MLIGNTTFLESSRHSLFEGQIEFWSPWKEVWNKYKPNGLGNAQKTVVWSFAAVWSRAIVLKHHPPQHDPYAGLRLVLSPVRKQQRKLWEALRDQNRRGFMEYFMLSEVNAGAVYNQWQCMFGDLQKGRELPWKELISATDNLLNAIQETQTPQARLVKSTAHAPPVKTQKTDTTVAADQAMRQSAIQAPAASKATSQPPVTPDQPQTDPNKQSRIRGVWNGFVLASQSGPPNVFRAPKKRR